MRTLRQSSSMTLCLPQRVRRAIAFGFTLLCFPVLSLVAVVRQYCLLFFFVAGRCLLLFTLNHFHRSLIPLLQRPDFYEGVRSVLVDKGRGPAPAWEFPRIEDVPEAVVDALFAMPLSGSDATPRFN